MPINAEIWIVVIALAYTIISVILQRTLTNPKKTREIQRRMKEISQELNDLVKRNAEQETIRAKQAELMPLMSKSMMSSFKPMFAILPIFLVLYYWLVPHLLVFMPQVFASTSKTAVSGLFFMSVFVLGLASSFVVLAYDKKKASDELKQANSNGSVQNNTV